MGSGNRSFFLLEDCRSGTLPAIYLESANAELLEPASLALWAMRERKRRGEIPVIDMLYVKNRKR